MENGTFHYVQRYIGEVETQLTPEHPEVLKQEVWSDVPFVKDGNVVALRWRSRRFVTAANYVDTLRAEEDPDADTHERYRVVKRTFHEEVIVPRWRYIETLTGVDPEAGEVWERVQYGENGIDWRSRTFTAARNEIGERMKNMSDDAKMRIIHPDGFVEDVFSRHDVVFAESADAVDAVDDDDELTEVLEEQVGQVPDEGDEPTFEVVDADK